MYTSTHMVLYRPACVPDTVRQETIETEREKEREMVEERLVLHTTSLVVAAP